jgi:cell division protein FtsW (lipid II flippase)
VLLAVGRHLLSQAIEEFGWVAIVLVIALVLLVIYWPRIAAWVERRWF